MPILKDDPGANIKEEKPSEDVTLLPNNRTMIVTKLTGESPVIPEINTKCNSLQKVFENYNPTAEINFVNQNEAVVNEKIRFGNLGDFGKRGILKNSSFLQELENDLKDYNSLYNTVKSNRVLERVLANPEAKQAYLSMLKEIIIELDSIHNH